MKKASHQREVNFFPLFFLFLVFQLIFFKKIKDLFTYFKERERKLRGGEGQRKSKRENLKQTPS